MKNRGQKLLHTLIFVFTLGFFLTVSAQFHVVGYFPTWAGSVDEIQYDKLTCINYSFILPSDGFGGLTGLGNPSRLNSLVSAAHGQDVKVCIAVGGWNGGDDSNFETMAADPESRALFIDNLLSFVEDYNLDGVDMDWEYPDQGSSADNYAAMMGALGDSLHAHGKILTAAVIGSGDWAGLGVKEEVFAYVDYLNIMSYDHGGTNHSSWDDAVNDLNYWLNRGLPAEKAVLGVPFYGRGGGQYVGYSSLVAQDPEAPWKNNVGDVYYNGIPLIQQKTVLALENGGGIMFWELSQDTHDNTSLLSAIDDTIQGYQATPVAENNMKLINKTQESVFTSSGSKITIKNCIAGNFRLSVYTLRGRKIFERNLTKKAEASVSISLPVESIAEGNYIIQLRGAGFKKAEKMFIGGF